MARKLKTAATARSEPAPASVDPAEVEKFSQIAAEWWDPHGKFGVLHKFNPVRLSFIRTALVSHFERDGDSRRPLEGLSILDIGCGGGLLCEPMARLGADVTGIDPSEKNIKTASVHAGEKELPVTYLAQSAEELAASGAQYDVVLNMEVIEHVADVDIFMNACCTLVKSGGLMFVATINRTLKSFGLAIIGAEYVLGWLPKGTHQWEKFLTPEEITRYLSTSGMRVKEREGVIYNPLTREWRPSRDTSVNYMILAEKPR
ncbi:MAG: bifunctional 2-polyprenyl-6-hydroxyphenol methylase/3-demethylubiquinol 3-O-methyltransferase UbiG [Hyphomicrobiales bacterium]